MSEPDYRVLPYPLAAVRQALRRSAREILSAVVPLAVVLAVLGYLFRSQERWGDVATWVVAVTTLLAFLAAAFAGLVAYQVLDVELSRDRVAAEERRVAADEHRRAQASLVAAWYEERVSLAPVYSGSGPATGHMPMSFFGAIIRNASQLPVFEVRVSFCVPLPAASGLSWRQGERYLSDHLQIVPPGEERVEIPRHVYDAERADGNEPQWLVAVEFTDAEGHRWLREPRGKLGPARITDIMRAVRD